MEPPPRHVSVNMKRRITVNRVVSQDKNVLILPGKEVYITTPVNSIAALLKKYIQPLFNDEDGKLSILVAEDEPSIALKLIEEMEDCTTFIVMEREIFDKHYRILENHQQQ
jgi:inorganic pyrophosphatase